MREVSALAVNAVLDSLRAAGVEPTPLCEGLALGLDSHGVCRSRVDWDVYAEFGDRLLDALGDAELTAALRKFGKQLPALGGVASWFVSPLEFLLFVFSQVNPRVYPHLVHRSERVAPETLRINVEIPSPYRGSRGFFLAALGSAEAVAWGYFGLPMGEVEVLELNDRRMRVRVRYPGSEERRRRIRPPGSATIGAFLRWWMGASEDETRAAIDDLRRLQARVARRERYARELAASTETAQVVSVIERALREELRATQWSLSVRDDDSERERVLSEQHPPRERGLGVLVQEGLATRTRPIGTLAVRLSPGDELRERTETLYALLPLFAIALDRARLLGVLEREREELTSALALSHADERVGSSKHAFERAAERWALTARQREALEALAQGLRNREIADRLGCSVGTVEFHLTQLLRKSGCDSRAALLSKLWGFARE